MPRLRFLFLFVPVVLLVGACSDAGDPNQGAACGPNGTCPSGFTCDLKSNQCLASATPDAPRFPDSSTRTFDAGPGAPDARPGAPDASPGAPDARISFPDAGPPPLAPCLTEAKTTGANDATNGGGCLDATPTTGAAGELTFLANPGSYSCTLNTTGQPTNTQPALGTPFSCSPGIPIAFARLDDLGDGRHAYTLAVAGGGTTTNIAWNIDTTPPQVALGTLAPSSADGTLAAPYTVTSADDVAAGVTFPTCTVDGLACDCGATGATCADLSAGLHTVSVAARDAFGNVGTAVKATATMSYGPAGGRAILIGTDYSATSATSTALLQAAVSDVPWKKSRIFDRPLRVVTFQGGTDDATESANVQAAIAAVTDGHRQFVQADDIPTNLPGNDVLLVLDQNNPTSATATGTTWAEDGTLRNFLDAGGVVVVLDGQSGGAASGTFRVLAAGDDPILRVDSAETSSTPGWGYSGSVPEQAFGTTSDLHVADSIDTPGNTLFFDFEDPQLAEGPFQSGDEGTTVGVKIFPAYNLTVTTSATALTVQTDLDIDAITRVDCLVSIQSCSNLNGCCPSASPTATTCSCTPLDEDAHTFQPPKGSGSYEISTRVMTPRFERDDPRNDARPRPGRVGSLFVDIPEPAVTVFQIPNNFAFFCYKGTDAAGQPMSQGHFVPQEFDFGTNSWVNRPPLSANNCPAGEGWVGSFTVCDPSGFAHYRVDAQDDVGNTGSFFHLNTSVPRTCP